MRTFLFTLVATATVVTGYYVTTGGASNPSAVAAIPPSAAAPTRPGPIPSQLIMHEWGTFTSFSAANGVPVSFTPNNTDLPPFVYSPPSDTKAARLSQGGLVSMETPVIYFYTDKETRVSVKVDFPRGWITEWYPYAHQAPTHTARNDRTGGQSISWDVKLLPHEPARFPTDRNNSDNHYYHARATDAVPLQAEVHRSDEYNEGWLRGGTILQREKFLFYRGVGSFPPPVTVQALGGGKVRVTNGSGGRVAGLVLVTVQDGKLGFRALGELENGAKMDSPLPNLDGSRTELGELLVQQLTAAGLYEKEAKAMVKTWDSAWFGEEGSRLLYLVPRTKTDELLPLTMEPKPTDVVRVLVGRHDFLTPEQEAMAEAALKRIRAAQAELDAASASLQKLGRFTAQAQQIVTNRLDAKTATQKK